MNFAGIFVSGLLIGALCATMTASMSIGEDPEVESVYSTRYKRHRINLKTTPSSEKIESSSNDDLAGTEAPIHEIESTNMPPDNGNNDGKNEGTDRIGGNNDVITDGNNDAQPTGGNNGATSDGNNDATSDGNNDATSDGNNDATSDGNNDATSDGNNDAQPTGGNNDETNDDHNDVGNDVIDGNKDENTDNMHNDTDATENSDEESTPSDDNHQEPSNNEKTEEEIEDEKKIETFHKEQEEKEARQLFQERQYENGLTNSQNPIEHLFDENKVIYGDAILTKEQNEMLFGKNTSYESTQAKATITNPFQKWDTTILYDFAEEIKTDGWRKTSFAVRQAIAEIEGKSCIRFKKRTNEEIPFIRFVREDGCWSYVGKINDVFQPQPISLGHGCEYKATATHEIMHALGFFHEHSRPDRDNYINIIWGHIKSKQSDQFLRIVDAQTHGTPYDFSSVMHYKLDDFGIEIGSTKLTTIVPKDKNIIKVGQPYYGGLSDFDAIQLNKLYCQNVNGVIKIKPPTNPPPPTRVTILPQELLGVIYRYMDQEKHHQSTISSLRKLFEKEYPQHNFLIMNFRRTRISRFDMLGNCVQSIDDNNREILVCYSPKSQTLPKLNKKLKRIWQRIVGTVKVLGVSVHDLDIFHVDLESVQKVQKVFGGYDTETCNAGYVRRKALALATASVDKRIKVSLVLVMEKQKTLQYTHPQPGFYSHDYQCAPGKYNTIMLYFSDA